MEILSPEFIDGPAEGAEERTPSQSNEVEPGSDGAPLELYHRTDLEGNPGNFSLRFFPAAVSK
jgi:hypothetical protein